MRTIVHMHNQYNNATTVSRNLAKTGNKSPE